jgi:alpha-L-arabinofuranosidase
VNAQAEPQAIRIKTSGAELAPSANVWRIAADNPEATNTADKQGVSIAGETNVPFSDRVTVPAYSVNLYRVRIAP